MIPWKLNKHTPLNRACGNPGYFAGGRLPNIAKQDEPYFIFWNFSKPWTLSSQRNLWLWRTVGFFNKLSFYKYRLYSRSNFFLLQEKPTCTLKTLVLNNVLALWNSLLFRCKANSNQIWKRVVENEDWQKKFECIER